MKRKQPNCRHYEMFLVTLDSVLHATPNSHSFYCENRVLSLKTLIVWHHIVHNKGFLANFRTTQLVPGSEAYDNTIEIPNYGILLDSL